MTIPGTNLEDGQDAIQIDPAQAAAAEAAAREAEPQEDEDDNLIPTVQVGQQQMAPVSEVIRLRKEARAAKKEAAELKTRVERAEAVGAQLQEVMPLIDNLRNMSQAQRDALLSGKLPSVEGTRQDAEDTEAREVAEDYGLIAADGSLDIARARKIIDKENARVERRVQEQLGPVKQHSAQQQAGVMRERAKAIKDEHGMPFATPESIDEAYSLIPAELAANPNVAIVQIGTAMFLDKMRKRTVRGAAGADPGPGYQAPIYSEGGGRRAAAPALTAEEKASAAKLGLSEKELTDASTALSRAAGGRRGIALE